MGLSVVLLSESIDYDGSQLGSLFGFRTTGIVGDAAVAFLGGCDVRGEALVDLEDRRAGATIISPLMLHVIVEHFGERLESMVLRQRLFARLAADLLRERCGREVAVDGDDLFVAGKKASVSIATVSPVSALFHFGINVRTEGAPVPAIGLAELGVDAPPFARALLDRYAAETADVAHAAAKVRWVR
jgi:hypothetical protein